MLKGFSDLGINEQLQQGLADLQISAPTDIQEKSIPVASFECDGTPGCFQECRCTVIHKVFLMCATMQT